MEFRPRPCTHCGVWLTKEQSVDYHKKLHEVSDVIFHCAICNKKFQRKIWYEQHLKECNYTPPAILLYGKEEPEKQFEEEQQLADAIQLSIQESYKEILQSKYPNAVIQL